MSDAKFPVFRLTQEAYDQLLQVAKESPEKYLDRDVDFARILAERDVRVFTESTDVFSKHAINLSPVSNGPPNRSDAQALDFYDSLIGVTARVATDDRMWAWITHFKLHSYGLERWRRNKNTDLSTYIRAHWFVGSRAEGLWLYNTAARLWWIAHTAKKAAQASGGAFTAQEALDDFAKYAVHYHIVMTKYSFTRSPTVLAELVRALLKEARGMKAEAGLYAITKRLNLVSGTRILDVLPREELRSSVVEIVDDVMSDPDMVTDRTKLRNRVPFRSLNLGAGVQSTVLALMADREEYDLPRPDVAVFADTGWEPPQVYEHLEWLKSELSFEVVTVSAGNIRDNLLQGKRPNGRSYLGIPAHIRNPDGSEAISRRQCTDDYKIRPIQNWLRGRLGLKAGRRAPKDVQVEMWMGISVDEVMRQKESRDEWITKRYPLIELGFNRYQLLSWFMEHYPGRYLPRSSCVGCPYRSDPEWKGLKELAPDAFREAVEVDEALRGSSVVREAITSNGGEAYLHRSRTPLSRVDFSSAPNYDDLMQQECDGLCGI